MSATTDGRIVVLHVDDDPDFAELAATFLEREDDRFEVETATSADAGLDRLADGTFDCVISDYDMPGRNGIEFLRAVRESHPDLPFVLFTGKGSEAVASEAISAGVTDYLQKESGTDQYAVLANRVENAVTADRAERQRRRQLEAIEAAPIGVSLADATEPDNPLTYANPAFERLTGYDRTEALGRNCRFLQGPGTDPDRIAELRAAVDDEKPVTAELRNYRQDGTEFWNRVSVAPVENDDGTVTHYVGFQEDVTETKAHEAVIKALHGATRESITAGSEDEIARIVTETAVELLGFSHTGVHLYDEEFEGLVPACWTDSASRTIGEPPALGPDSLAWDAFESGESRLYEAPDDVDVQNPETVLTSELVVPLGRRGVVIVSSIEHDAFGDDDRRLLELLCANATAALNRVAREELFREHERELERRNERLEEFVSVVSHDLRNPLNVVGGRLDLALEDCDSQQLQGAVDAIDWMETLIEDLLALARKGETVSETEPVDLAALAEDCWQTVDTAGTGATLEVATDRTVRADRSRLRQLLENLVGNAVRHGAPGVEAATPEGAGTGAVEHDDDGNGATRAQSGPPDDAGGAGAGVRITMGELDDESGFYVADDGPGIPEADRESVLESGYSTDREGTGFGLAIVRQIAEAHGWDVRVTESDAGGARIEIAGVAFD